MYKRQTLEKELGELDLYRQRVAALRESILGTMAGLEQKTVEMEQQVERLYGDSPAGNLTLFR